MYEHDKGQLRRLALSKRNELCEAYRKAAGDEICARLLNMPEIKNADVIMSYRSFRTEADTGKIVENLLVQGKTLCFPLCEKAGIMRAYCPDDESAWKKSKMGIMEPDIEKSRLVAPEEIAVVICPLVAFDDKCHRLGYGGGYYDRYLPRCSKALRIGIAFEAQRLENIITDAFDQPMDIIITEEKMYRKSPVSL